MILKEKKFLKMKIQKKYLTLLKKIINFNTNSEGINILTSTQMLQKLSIALAQVKAGNISKNVLNGIRQIVYSLYWEKQVLKKVYNNIINSIKL